MTNEAKMNQDNETAVTSDGRTVVLKSDGTWQYSAEVIVLSPGSDEHSFRKTKWGVDKQFVKRILFQPTILTTS